MLPIDTATAATTANLDAASAGSPAAGNGGVDVEAILEVARRP